jgi:hypothetical protein
MKGLTEDQEHSNTRSGEYPDPYNEARGLKKLQAREDSRVKNMKGTQHWNTTTPGY